MAPKIISTRSHLDPNPPHTVENLEKILRKTPRTESQTSSRVLHKSNSLLENFVTLQDIQFHLHFEQGLFRTKSENWIDHTVFDPSILYQSPVTEA